MKHDIINIMRQPLRQY